VWCEMPLPPKIAFLPRDAYHSADYAVPKCPSVCLSVCYTPVLCYKRLYISSKVISPSDSPTILTFFTPNRNGMEIFDGDPLIGASNARGYKKSPDFRSVSRFISQLMQDRAIVSMKGE